MEQEEQQQEQQTEEKTQEWDKERQRADQAESMARKAKEEAEALSQSLAETTEKLNKLEEQQRQAQQEYQKAKDDFDVMDTLTVDPAVIKNLQRLKDKVDKLENENKNLVSKATAYEEAENKRYQESQKKQTIERILKPLDEEFGAKYRNEAMKLADDLVDTGKVKQPNDPLSAAELMRRCYKEIVAKNKPKEKETVPSDSGVGGISHSEPKKKPGTMQEVLADMRKNPSTWRGKT